MANLQIANFSEFGQRTKHSWREVSNISIDELVGKVMFRAYATGLSGHLQETSPDVLVSVDAFSTVSFSTTN